MRGSDKDTDITLRGNEKHNTIFVVRYRVHIEDINKLYKRNQTITIFSQELFPNELKNVEMKNFKSTAKIFNELHPFLKIVVSELQHILKEQDSKQKNLPKP